MITRADRVPEEQAGRLELRARSAPFAGQLLLACSLFLIGAPVFAGSDADLPGSRELELETSPDVEPVAATTTEVPPAAADASTAPAGIAEPAAQPAPQAEVAPDDRDSLLALARNDIAALGPLSLGSPDAGLLVNPIAMPEGPLWTIRDASESYGTAETIGFVATAVGAVEARYPGSPRLVIGDISRPDGGRLNRHRSHQAGRDVDLGFYYLRGECGEFKIGREGDLDLPRTWALVRALVTETDIERIFLDRRLQRLLYAQALAEGEDRDWLDDVFFGGFGDEPRKGIIQHERGHRNHLHVRFYNGSAQERARIVYATLVEAGSVPPPVVKHRVRRGETLGHLAVRYGTSASAIRAANRLRGNRLRAGRGYLIPIRRVPPDEGPIAVPPRRLPPQVTQAVDSTPPGIEGVAPTFAR